MGISGADVAARLGVTRAAIWARIEELRHLGYVIEATPHSGYRLVEVPDALHADDLSSQLAGVKVIGSTIQVFEETGSTNDLVDRRARDGAREGLVVFAESQSRGRGRLGRSWSSPARKGLWFSVLLRPGMAPQTVPQLTVFAAASLARGVRNVTGLAIQIKWPNDLEIQGRKCAGILTELSAEADRVRYVVLGIGLDVNQAPDDWPAALRGSATSLRIETGRTWNRPELAVEVLRQLDTSYVRLIAGEFEEIADEWESACGTLGKSVSIRIGDRRVRGRAESLDSDGALLIRTEHGHLERVTGGDVSVEK